MKREKTFWRDGRGDLKTGRVSGKAGEMIREMSRNDA